jgi:nucleotide-binding universal stress UspA family protein
MIVDQRPVVVAYDGSAAAAEAVRKAADLFPGRVLIVVSVWEPGMAMAVAGARDPASLGYASPGIEEMVAVDRMQRDHAAAAAEQGADVARALGATVEAVAVPDDVDVAETLASVAERRDAIVVVVGTHGVGGMLSRLFGSTTRKLLQVCDRPVLVVKAPG